MVENPYVYSGPHGQTVGQTSKAQYWQNKYAPMGYTDQNCITTDKRTKKKDELPMQTQWRK